MPIKKQKSMEDYQTYPLNITESAQKFTSETSWNFHNVSLTTHNWNLIIKEYTSHTLVDSDEKKKHC